MGRFELALPAPAMEEASSSKVGMGGWGDGGRGMGVVFLRISGVGQFCLRDLGIGDGDAGEFL